jgi:predicted DNA binding CopG/RHH family protein
MKRIHKREIKEHVVALKLASSLVDAIDREAMAEGLTRSAVIRRTLLAKHSEK